MLFDAAAPPQPEWAKPLPYHRMAHESPATAQWWRPLAALGVFVGLVFAATVVLILLGVLVSAAAPSLAPSEELQDATNPLDMLINLGSVAVMLPLALLAARLGSGRLGSVHSVAGRFRWRFMGKAAPYVLGFFGVLILGPVLLFGRSELSSPGFSPAIVSVYIIILLLTPLQCAAEEYVFRGLPQQGFGTWVKNPWLGILLPVPLFMLGHGYDWVGQIDVGVFALCAGLLAWKSGGLELPILVHVSNNLFSFLLAPFAGPQALAQGAVDPASLLFSLPTTLIVTAGLWWYTNRAYQVRWFEPVRRPAPDARQAAQLAQLDAQRQLERSGGTVMVAPVTGGMPQPGMPGAAPRLQSAGTFVPARNNYFGGAMSYQGLRDVADRAAFFSTLRQRQFDEAVREKVGDNVAFSLDLERHTLTFTGEQSEIGVSAQLIATVSPAKQQLAWAWAQGHGHSASSDAMAVKRLGDRFHMPALTLPTVPFVADVADPIAEAKELAQLAGFIATEAIRDDGFFYNASDASGTRAVVWVHGPQLPAPSLAAVVQVLPDLVRDVPVTDQHSAVLGLAEHLGWYLQWRDASGAAGLLSAPDGGRAEVLFDRAGALVGARMV